MERNSLVHVLFFFIMSLYTTQIDTSRSSIQSNRLVSYSIPDKRLLKKALGFNEDIYLNFTELTTKYNYPTEVHSITTEDGYVLRVFRILSKCSETTKAYPVMLLHGIFDTSDMWVIPDTRIGLGYVLADNCYDVWAANIRGNYYSRRHLKLDPNVDPEYWEYSFDEVGNFDIPAVIDYILQKTGFSKLFYVGHSQGTTAYFSMASLRPGYNDKIMLAVMLGPVAWFKNAMNPLISLVAKNYKFIQNILDTGGFKEIFARDRFVHHFAEFLCQKSPDICELFFTLITGHKKGTLSIETISISVGHLFSGSSTKNLAHFAQLMLSGEFQRFDEDTKGNLQRYGSAKPPQYNVSLISSPIVLVAAENDALSLLKDVSILSSKLPNLVENYIVPKPYWSHHNHIWGINAPKFVYTKILKYFNTFKSRS